MDIFTTQLTKVQQTPIKPSRLKIKSLKKEGKTKSLDQEQDHLSGDVQLHEEINANIFHENTDENENNNEVVEPLLYDDIHKENCHHKEAAYKVEGDDDETPPHVDVFI